MRGEPFTRDSRITTQQLAKMMAVHISSVRLWCDFRGLPHHRTPGGHRRFVAGELVAYLREKGIPVPRELEGVE